MLVIISDLDKSKWGIYILQLYVYTRSRTWLEAGLSTFYVNWGAAWRSGYYLVLTPAKARIVFSSKKRYPYCLVLV